MKKKIALILIMTTLLLSGCSAKESLLKDTIGQNAANKTSTSTDVQAPKDSSSSERVEVKTDFEAVKPGSLPQLSDTLKSEVDKKFKPTLEELQKTMKSIQDAQDIDLNSIK